MLAVEVGLSLTAGLLEGRREDRVMGEARLHVVFGTGQAGKGSSAQLAGVGVAVPAASRHWASHAGWGADWRAAGAADREVAACAAKGASVVYQCVNAPYAQWPGAVSAVAAGVLAAAERTGALQVVVENLRGYGWARSRAGPPREKEKGSWVLFQALSANATIANGYDPSRGGPPGRLDCYCHLCGSPAHQHRADAGSRRCRC